MVYTEIQDKKGEKHYYRAISIREGKKFRKVRKYLGKNLTKTELKKKEAEANKYLENVYGRRKRKIEDLNLYKQSGAGFAITIGMPMNWIFNPIEIEKGFTIIYPGDMVYSTPDFQFYHFFISEETKPVVDQLFLRFENDFEWVKKRIKEFENAVEGFEEMGEKLIESGEKYNEKNKKDLIKVYEKFLKKDYSYWTPSLFIDLLDTYEEEILNFIFGNYLSKISKEDLQVLLLPDRSVYWEEKEDLEQISKYFKSINKDKADKKLWQKLMKHAEKYWWLRNDYQTVKKLGARDFLSVLNENLDSYDAIKIIRKKRILEKRYGFDDAIIKKLRLFSDVAYFRDLRKKVTQMANYYIVTFYHNLANKFGIPENWSNFVVPFIEHKKFFSKDKKFFKELEERTKNGVWMIGSDVDWKTTIETKKAKEILKIIEDKMIGKKILYGNTASLGNVTGKVKIVLRQSDFYKFEEGDILITGMTRPEFVPLMKKAGAIVTDEGGITSHAAIISRELRKPCVIATRIATKSFEDNDLVEVNANHGVVKLLERKSS